MRILIIGGGIGGLALAAALRKLSINCLVFERAPQPTEVGAGISMWPNALKALDWLGAAHAARSRGLAATDAHIKSASGHTITRANMQAVRHKLGAEFLMIHRAELLNALLTAVDPASIRWAHTLTRIHDSSERITAHFDNGSSESGDLLIGADGLRSIVREHTIDTSPPRPAGQTAYRGLVTLSHPSFPKGSIWEVWGIRARFGITCLPRGQIYWWATHDAAPLPPGTNPHNPQHQRDLLAIFGSGAPQQWCEPVEALIRATDPAHIVRHDLFDRPPRLPWSRGRAALLGDAAHPMTPNLGQGGCTAIEDAVILARCLHDIGPAPAAAAISHALSRYQRARYRRTASIVRQSRFLGWWGQRPSAWQCRARDAIFRIISPLTFERSMMQLGAYDAGSAPLEP
jgi:2-polyprenyl-6-methoxyphenol hydroxylase-like FAD-dependent oxidoreductase